MRAAIMESNGTTVHNVIEYDPDRDYTPKAGLTLVILADTDVVGPGYIKNGTVWEPPPPYVPTVQETNKTSLEAKANAAFAANATFLALAAPTNAQTLNQVQLITKEFNALAKLYLGKLDNTVGT